MKYIGDSRVVAQFVVDLLRNSGSDSLLITITVRGKSEDCFVSIVTDTSSEGIVKKLAQDYSLQLIDT